MTHDSTEKTSSSQNHAATGRHDELFCIHSYAGEAGPACGWRGRTDEALRTTKVSVPRCPRCGRATLMELPAN